MQFTITIPKRCRFDIMDDHGKVATISCPEEDYEGIAANLRKESVSLRIENLRMEEGS